MINKIIILLFILSAVGLLLRVQGISFGLPYLYHQDERATVGVAVKFGLGDMHPHYFFHPNLLHYLLFFLYGIYFFIGRLIGSFASVTDFKSLFFTNPTIFYLIGRVTGAILGTATIPLLYLLGKRIYNESIGLLAAFFLTFTFLHIRNSHYIRHDIPVTFFIVFAYIFIYRLFETGRLKDYLLAGLISGLAVSTNWNAGILIFSILTSHILRYLKRNKDIKIFINKKIFLCFFMVTVGIFIGTPFLFLDFRSAIPDFIGLFWRGAIFTTSKTAAVSNAWITHLTHYLKIGMGIPMLILAIFGFFYTTIKHKKEGLLLITFPLIYYIFIGKPSWAYGEHIIPTIPFLCLFAAKFLWNSISSFNSNLKIKNLLLTIALISIIFIPLRDAIYHNYLLLQKDTRTLAKEWIEVYIPSGTKIAMERYIAMNSRLPPLVETKEQNAEILAEIVRRDRSKGKTRAEILKLPYNGITYTIIDIIGSPYLFKKYENYYDFNKLISDGVRYVILSSFWYDFLAGPLQSKFYKELETKATLVKVFKPFKDNEDSFIQDYASFTPFTNVTKLIRPGPVIKIYRLR